MTDKIVMSLSAAVILTVAAQASAQTPTLAELARREEARRKAVTAPAKVVTSADVPKGTAAAAKPGAAVEDDKTGKASDSADKAGAKPDEPVKDAAWWQDRVTTVRDELRRTEMFVDAMQTKVNSLSADFAARDDPYQRARVGEERTRAIAEMDRAKAEIEQLKKKIAEIEDDARRTGVPPGWVR